MSKKHPGRDTHWAKFDSWMAKTDNYVEALKKKRALKKTEKKRVNKKTPKSNKGLRK